MFPWEATLDTINDVLTASVPHNRALGLKAVERGHGYAVLELPYAEQLVGNPDTKVIHGGAITSLLDAVGGLAVFMTMQAPARIATIDLRIDYMGQATPGRAVLGRAECYKLTRHVAFMRGVAYHDNPADPIAAAAGTYMIFHDEVSPTARALAS